MRALCLVPRQVQRALQASIAWVSWDDLDVINEDNDFIGAKIRHANQMHHEEKGSMETTANISREEITFSMEKQPDMKMPLKVDWVGLEQTLSGSARFLSDV